jgi:RimJ/RimL family protein N-acetyltransferase
MAEIGPADDIDFARYFQGMQVTTRWVGRAMRRGRLIAGFGGLLETNDGEWLAFLEVPAEERKPHVYRHVLAAFSEAKALGARRITAWCDTTIPGAEKLMKRLGFEKTDEIIEDKEVWAWGL